MKHGIFLSIIIILFLSISVSLFAFEILDPTYGIEPLPSNVQIQTPSDNFHLTGLENNFRISGVGYAPKGLDELIVEVSANNEVRIDHLYYNLDLNFFTFDAYVSHLLFRGRNTINVIATDENNNEFSDSITLWYLPLPENTKLLILCPEEFYINFSDLQEWKNEIGMSCHIMTLESIEMDVGHSLARDIQEKIKKILAYVCMYHNTRYVILGGDVDKFPVRYISATKYNKKSYDFEYHSWIPSDLYYADLFESIPVFETWDSNGNNILGEWGKGIPTYQTMHNFRRINTDDCNLFPDIAVGRIPASDSEELSIYIDKLLYYERDIMANKTPEWFNNILLYTDNNKHISNYFFNDLKGSLHWISHNTFQNGNFNFLEEYNHSYPSLIVNDTLNSGVGFAFLYGTGYPIGFAVGNYNYYLGNLQNEDKLPVILANASRTARFAVSVDRYVNINGYLPEEKWISTKESGKPEPMAIQPSEMDQSCIGEQFLFESSHGAVAFIGSQLTEVLDNDWYKAEDKFYGKGYAFCDYFPQAWDEGIHRLGDMWNYALNNFIQQIHDDMMDNEKYDYLLREASHMHSFILFGDPSLYLGHNPSIEY